MSHVQKRTDRNWVARYRTPDGRERSKSFRRKVDAARFLAQVEVDKARGDWVDPRLGKTDLGEWAQTWLETTSDLRASTRARDESILSNHVLPRFGATPLAAIDYMAVRSWVADLSKRLSPASVHKAHQVLSKVLRSAVAAGLISKNAAENVPLPRQDRTEMRMLTPVEVQALADAMDPRYRAVVITAAYTGLRVGELTALRRSNIDLLRRRITVTETLVEVKGELIFNPPKTARGFRSVPIANVVARELEQHLLSYGEGAPDSLVFAAPEGGPLRLSLWRRRFFLPAVQRAGLEHLRIHELRHTAVSLWIAAGASPVEVAKWAGHSRTQTVFDVYGHLMPGTEEQVTDALDRMADDASNRVDPTTQVRRLHRASPTDEPSDAASNDS